jgi:hypothetical protein
MKLNLSSASAPEPKFSPKTLNTNIFPEEIPETLIDGLRLAYNLLNSKIRDAKEETNINKHISDLVELVLHGAYELVNVIQDAHDFYEPQLIDVKDRNYDLMARCDTLKRKNERLEKHHRHLVKMMSQVEIENID